MTPDVEQGVGAELQFLLKPGWTYTVEPTRFRIKLPNDPDAKKIATAELDDEVWRIARFVRYLRYASISKDDDGKYTFQSKSSSGSECEIVFDPT